MSNLSNCFISEQPPSFISEQPPSFISEQPHSPNLIPINFEPSPLEPITFENKYGQQIKIDALDFPVYYSYRKTKEEMSEVQTTNVLSSSVNNNESPQLQENATATESQSVIDEQKSKKRPATVRTGSKVEKKKETKKRETSKKKECKNSSHKKSKKKRRVIDDDDEEAEPDESDLDDTRSVDDESVGSLVEFIVDDEKAIEEEIKQSKSITVVDPLDGIDPSNIVTGKRQRKKPERYQDPHFWQLMTQDMDDSEIEQFEEEVKKEDEEQPDAPEEDEEFRVSEEVSESEDEDEIQTPSEEDYDPEQEESEDSEDD
jgi:hypothetical protein